MRGAGRHPPAFYTLDRYNDWETRVNRAESGMRFHHPRVSTFTCGPRLTIQLLTRRARRSPHTRWWKRMLILQFYALVVDVVK